MKQQLLDLVTTFLQTQHDPDDSWKCVDRSDLFALMEIVDLLISFKWGKDPHGNSAVECNIVDRSRTYLAPYIPINYYHEAEGKAMKIAIIQSHIANLRLAQESLDRVLRQWWYDCHDCDDNGK